MRHHKGLGAGHIYAHLKPDDGILLSEDATTTHPTHRLDDGDDYPSIIYPLPNDKLPDETPAPSIENTQINAGVIHATDAGDSLSFSFIPTLNGLADTGLGDIDSEGSVSNDGHDSEAGGEGSSADEGSDDDLVIEFDDMYGGDPFDLDYED